GLGIAPFPAAVYGLPALSVIVAPIVEEVSKALGIAFIRDRDPERHDGYIYGAAAGFGFAFTENLFYVATAYAVGGEDLALTVAVFRGIATVCLHGAATAFTGYGLWRLRYGGNPFPLLVLLPLAIALHAAYNALASLAQMGAALGAALLAVLVYRRILKRVRVHGRG
ncbi:MAG TPA: PrsW family glutamic-type intramembrane protease, partial [Candidatus Thermoplasmatota archaeon]|nr:PrsW family glutamic-type intramembrane protease [Candidatus Thermoplasmatota archaeon]